MGTINTHLNAMEGQHDLERTLGSLWGKAEDTVLPDALTDVALPYLQNLNSPVRSAPVTGFSALELRDRVVIMLLFDQVVYEEQVELAWQLWKQMSEDGTKEPLWRVLTLFPEVDRELVYAEAARVYGFETARISRGRAISLIHEVEQQVSSAHWDELVELRVIPITEAEQAHTHRQRMVYASQDPTRPEVHRLLPNLNLGGFELRYATEREIISLLIEAFPQRYNHLRSLSGVSKDFLAGGLQQDLPLAPLPLDTHTVVDLFTEVLMAAVRLGATDLCLMPTPTDEVEVYVQLNGQLKRERVLADHAASGVLSIIKSEVIQKEGGEDGRILNAIIERNIDGTVQQFRVSAVPPSEEIPTECIVVRTL